jgi:hypothetical protein
MRFAFVPKANIGDIFWHNTSPSNQELEGEEDLASFFAKRFAHGRLELPFKSQVDNAAGLIMDEEAGEDVTPSPPSLPGISLAPFVEFTTTRRRWKLHINGCAFNVDVDEASFGCCIAEFELMVICTAHCLSRIWLIFHI